MQKLKIFRKLQCVSAQTKKVNFLLFVQTSFMDEPQISVSFKQKTQIFCFHSIELLFHAQFTFFIIYYISQFTKNTNFLFSFN